MNTFTDITSSQPSVADDALPVTTGPSLGQGLRLGAISGALSGLVGPFIAVPILSLLGLLESPPPETSELIALSLSMLAFAFPISAVAVFIGGLAGLLPGLLLGGLQASRGRALPAWCWILGFSLLGLILGPLSLAILPWGEDLLGHSPVLSPYTLLGAIGGMAGTAIAHAIMRR